MINLFEQNSTEYFDIGDMVENISVPGSQGIVIQKDSNDIFYKIDWLLKEEGEIPPLISAHTYLDLRRISQPKLC